MPSLTPSAPHLNNADDPSDASAQRELVGLLGCCVAVLALSLHLDQGALQAPGRASSSTLVARYFSGTPTVVVLRGLRLVMLAGSATLLLWLVGLLTVAIVGRQRGRNRVARLPFGRLVVRSLSTTMMLALAGSVTATASMAAPRPHLESSVAKRSDSTGGQRWPSITATSMLPSVAGAGRTTLDGPVVRSVRSPVLQQPTVAPTLTTVAPTLTTVAPTLTTVAPTFTTVAPTPRAGAAVPRRAGPPFNFNDSPLHSVEFVTRPAVISVRDGAPTAGLPTVIVGRGESLWSIAEAQVLATIDEATERDIGRYWVALIDANRSRLPDPNNADLLFVNTVLVLPPFEVPRSAPN